MASVPMDDALSKSQDMVTTMRILHGKHVETTKKHDDELVAHAQTRNNLAKTQEAHDNKHEEHKREMLQHSETRSRLSAVEAELEVYKRRSADAVKGHEATKAEVSVERTRVASQKAAHVAEVKSLDEKHQIIASQLDQRNAEFEQVNEQHVSAKSQMDSAVRAQEAYRKEYHATVEALREQKEQTGRHIEELARVRTERMALDTQLKESTSRTEEARAGLSDRDARIATATAELDEHRRKARLIQEEYEKVQEMVESHRQ